MLCSLLLLYSIFWMGKFILNPIKPAVISLVVTSKGYLVESNFFAPYKLKNILKPIFVLYHYLCRYNEYPEILSNYDI
jgi:hypothetical protein